VVGRVRWEESEDLPENPFLQKVIFRTFPQKLLDRVAKLLWIWGTQRLSAISSDAEWIDAHRTAAFVPMVAKLTARNLGKAWLAQPRSAPLMEKTTLYSPKSWRPP